MKHFLLIEKMKQPTVSCSSTEAEYRSLATGTADLSWLRMFLRDLGVLELECSLAVC